MTGGLACRRMCVAVCLRTSREYLVPCDLEACEGRNCAKCLVRLALSWTIPRVVPVVLWVDCNGLSPVGGCSCAVLCGWCQPVSSGPHTRGGSGHFPGPVRGVGGPLGSVGCSVAGGLRASRHVSVYVNLMSQVRRLRTRVGAACVFLGIGWPKRSGV